MKFDEATFDSKPAPTGFVADVSSAARALMSQPTVALVSILLWSLPVLMTPPKPGPAHVNPWLFVADVALLLFMCGWAGAKRVFFLRHREGKAITLGHLLGLVKAFMGRFLALGFVVGLALIPFAIALAVLVGSPKTHSTQFRVGTMSFAVIMDFSLTFVPAALAFTTRSVVRALDIGFAMIRQTWPRSALYALCPPLALCTNNLIYPMNLPALRLIVAAGVAVVALLAKGATVAFYLREQPVTGDDGAAHISSTETQLQ